MAPPGPRLKSGDLGGGGWCCITAVLTAGSSGFDRKKAKHVVQRYLLGRGNVVCSIDIYMNGPVWGRGE